MAGEVAGALSERMKLPGLDPRRADLVVAGGVLLDTIAQVEQHRTLRKYDGFMKTGRVKFRGRQQRYI